MGAGAGLSRMARIQCQKSYAKLGERSTSLGGRSTSVGGRSTSLGGRFTFIGSRSTFVGRSTFIGSRSTFLVRSTFIDSRSTFLGRSTFTGGRSTFLGRSMNNDLSLARIPLLGWDELRMRSKHVHAARVADGRQQDEGRELFQSCRPFCGPTPTEVDQPTT